MELFAVLVALESSVSSSYSSDVGSCLEVGSACYSGSDVSSHSPFQDGLNGSDSCPRCYSRGYYYNPSSSYCVFFSRPCLVAC